MTDIVKTEMWAVVQRKTNRVILTEHAYWAIINRFNCGTATNFYQQHPEWRIKRCTVIARAALEPKP